MFRYRPNTLERRRKCSSERAGAFLLVRVDAGACGAFDEEAAGNADAVEEGEDVALDRRFAAVGFEIGVARRRMRVERMRLSCGLGAT